jgi:hypothetical protein
MLHDEPRIEGGDAMRKSIGFLSALGLVVTSTIIAGSPAFAVPITYTEEATATGSLGGTPFSGTVLLTMDNDTTNVAGGPVFVNIGTVTLDVAGFAPATFTDATQAVSNQTDADGGFGDNTENLAILFTSSNSFSTYDLKSAFGPVLGPAAFNPGASFPTTDGLFVLDSVPNSVTFTATTAAVPAPLIGRGLPIFLVVGGVLFGVKLLERSGKRRSLGTLGMSAT